jgi:hypothetical protein
MNWSRQQIQSILLLQNGIAVVVSSYPCHMLTTTIGITVLEEGVITPDKQWLIDLADAAKQQRRQQLRQTIDGAVEDLLEAGWEPGTIAEALLELADDHIG